MPDLRKHSNTSNIVRFKLTKSADGTAFTGLSSSSSGLIISIISDVEATPTAYTQAGSTIETITTLGTFATPTTNKCRFKEIDATNHPGLYEFQFADARFAVSSARRIVISVSGVTGLFSSDYEIELVQFDLFDAVRLGLTAIPNVAQGSTGSIPVSVDASGRVDVLKINGTSQTARDIGASVLLSVGTGTGQVNLSSGKVPATVAAGDLAADSLTASALATDAVQEIRNAITGGAYPLDTDANGAVRIVDGTSARELDTNAGNVALTAAAVQAIWDALTSALTTVGSIGKRLADDIDATISSRLASGSYTAPPSAAANASAVWEELTSGHSTSGSFGKLAVDNINASISSRSSHSASDVWAVATRVLTAGTNITLAKGTGVTGFNDIAAADVWAVTTRLLSAGTNIVLSKGTGITGFNDLDAAGVRAAVGLASANLDNQLDALPTANEVRNAVTGGNYPLDTDANGRMRIVDGTNAGELDTTNGLVKIAGTIQTLDSLNTAQVAEHDATQAAIAALNNISVADIFTGTMVESYAANEAQFTFSQGMYAMHQTLQQIAYAGLLATVGKLDGTPAFTMDLDDATNPTSISRAA